MARTSMRFRTSAIIIAGFLVSHAAGYVFYYFDRRDALEMTEAVDLAERAAGVSRLLRDLTPSWQSEIVQFSDSRTFRVWTSEASAVPLSDPTEEEKELLAYLRLQVPRIAGNEMRVRFVDKTGIGIVPPTLHPEGRAGSPASAEGAPPGGPGLAISIRHSDTEWINFLGALAPPKSIVPELLVANLASAVIGIGLIAFWLVGRVTRPLGQFARAAEELGQNLFRPPIAVDGPREVAVAARAFNRMQARLARLIQNRTEFLAAISHDLRTPLTQMRLRLEAMPGCRDRERMLRSIDDMDATLGTFLSYAHAMNDSEIRTKVDLGTIVSSVCDDLAECGQDVESDVDARLVFECKRVAIKRALANIIDNAVKYGGRARVTARRKPGSIVVAVEDEGPGIREEDVPLALQPFRRLAQCEGSQRIPGSGLGLSIAQAIMEDHGGELKLSNRDRGLRVELVFPS